MYSLTVEQEEAFYADLEEQVRLTVPKTRCMGMASMKPMPGITDESAYRHSLDNPVSGLPLREIARARNAKSACVLVSDVTRQVPTSRIAPGVVDELVAGGVPIDGILFVVAIGVHRDATEEEMREILGEKIWGKVKIVNHTPYSPDNLLHLGTTSQKTPVEVNRAAYECDLHISIGKVEPHEFAGFSGGRKSVLPGIASEAAIKANHAPGMLYSNKAIPGNLEGNPIHADMLESARMFRIDFCATAVLNEKNEPAAVFAGDMETSHKAAVDFLRGYCQVCFSKPDVIVTTPGAPLNIDFYQSLKPIIALTDVLDEDIVVALYCECREGINSPDMMRPFRETSGIDAMVDYVTQNYEIQMDHALLLSKILKKRAKIVVYSPHVPSEDIESMYMIPAKNHEDMLNKACELTGKAQPKVLFYPQAQRSLPIMER